MDPGLHTKPSEPPLGSRLAKSVAGVATRTILGHIVAAAVALGLVAIATPGSFGAYVIVGAVGMLGHNLLLRPFSQALIVIRDDQIYQRSRAAPYWWLQSLHVAVGALLVAGAFLVAPASWRVMLVALGLTVSVIPLRFLASVRLEREIRFDTLAGIGISEIVIFQVGSLVLYGCGLGDGSFGVALFAAECVAICLSLRAVPGIPRPRFRGAGAVVRPVSAFFTINVAELARDSLTPLLVAVGGTAAAAGLFGWGAKVAQVPMLVPQVLLVVLLPAFALGVVSRRESDQLLGRSVRAVLFLSSVGAAWALACLPSFTSLFLNTSWRQAEPLAWLLCCAVVLQGAAGTVLQRAYADGHRVRPALVQVLALLPLALGIWVGSSAGVPALGASAGMLGAAIVVATYGLLLAIRVYEVPCLGRTAVAAALLLAVAAAPAIVVPDVPPGVSLACSLVLVPAIAAAVVQVPYFRFLRVDIPSPGAFFRGLRSNGEQ